ncbi:hypothetical protein GQ53DRAFT_715281 [Thozetella sp. PMI_491]|nr:hypothetical protein GQ53DRAFT_715281 [Thozetella sp. PMI_491]
MAEECHGEATVRNPRNPGSGHETPPSRRKACNECRQQKLRCDLAAGDDDVPRTCSRCLKFGLVCKIEPDFKRSRKRRRSFELENEIKELRRQLRDARDSEAASTNGLLSSEAVPTTIRHHVPSISGQSGDESVKTSRLAGLTTKPIIDQVPTATKAHGNVPQPRSLDGVDLSADEIDEIFFMYFRHYHPCLPFLTPTLSPHECYEQSELLFWSIVSVASRRHQSRPTLLTCLAQAVTDLLWSTLRRIPYSLQVVQSLVLLCTWPFPTSSSTADPTYMFVGVMVQTGTQMGLHRARNAQDFNKVPLRLEGSEYDEWVRTWQACSIVAQSVSLGCGLPTAMQMQDWTLAAAPQATTSDSTAVLSIHLRIEQFRYRLSQILLSDGSNHHHRARDREKQTTYKLLNAMLGDLERDVPKESAVAQFYLSAARLSLHSLYLFDDSTSDGYIERIICLYGTASLFIEQTLEMDGSEGGFLQFCPFFCYQVFVSAAFVVLKLTKNDSLASLLDAAAGERLVNASISALRRMSLANNDLPARLSDVITFFFALPNAGTIGGKTLEDLQLRVKNRLSMSIVYDSLWEWRNWFRHDERRNEEALADQDKSLPVVKFQMVQANPPRVRSELPFEDTQFEFTFDHLDNIINSLDFDSFPSPLF